MFNLIRTICHLSNGEERVHLKTAREVSIGVLCLLIALVLVPGSSQGSKAGSAAQWTLMVYLDADNNLDSYASYSLGMMQQVGSTANVNVLAFWDGLYTPAYMYKVVLGGLELVPGFALNGKEVNMGDASTLEAFVDFSVRKFQAEHYVLVLWDHGNDVSGICWDEHPEDHLTHPEVASALSGHHIDILSTDACLMAMVEVAYEYNQYGVNIDYLVGSENYVPVAGYPYDMILGDLNQNPAMSAFDAVQMITYRFAEFYEPRPHFNGGVMATLSAIDISKMDELVSTLMPFTTSLMGDMEANHDMISEARGEGMLPWSEYGWDQYIDLPTFVEYITSATTDPQVKQAGDLVLSALNQAIVALGNSEPMDSASAQGMGVWFPPSYHAMWGLSPYSATMFASQGWLDFLYSYWNDHHK